MRRFLTGQVLVLRQVGRVVLGSGSMCYFTVDDHSKFRPLYLCLGGPGGTDEAACRAVSPAEVDDSISTSASVDV